ncbi:L-aspartate oxidase [Planococcus maritimus]|uniref:L-aspartate oxidase n=1 Tax=Planococcus maritimus TaxID=192421 RepID=UPI000791D466|nr:L-aspartate oxidase [Planococcus maritimus]KYG58381.1 L-aspartate oxidase [Planococcus maritimus]
MYDVCIIGGGVAGLMLARSLPDSYSIALLTKQHAYAGNTALAQGGIAASISVDDCAQSHAIDTMLASAHHADAERVDILVREGADIVAELLAEGLPYDADRNGQPSLGMEGAHSTRRILHAGGDQTGSMLMQFLLEDSAENITRLPGHQALELIVSQGRCIGVLVSQPTGDRTIIRARHIVLATGGIGQLYCQTSNSSVATGDGLSLAYHAGAVLEDLEFVQFHPTVLTIGGKSCGLISEAVRGEGALLVDRNGKRIMAGIHPLMELAPRDVVARAIEWHWQQHGPVYLDARKVAEFAQHFPSIQANCMRHGIDPRYELIPVRPGAHFHMGGVKTDSYGATTVAGLFAIGEVASTGVHGANRLASNSLLEGLVFGRRLAERIKELHHQKMPLDVPVNFGASQRPDFEALDESELKKEMTHIAGILRHPEQLARFLKAHPLRSFPLRDYPDELIAEIHRSTASSLIATAALLREESRGGHYRIDIPEMKEQWTGKVIELSKQGTSLSERKIYLKETV